MQDLLITRGRQTEDKEPSFHPHVEDQHLLVAPEVAEVILELRLRSARSLLSYLRAFPMEIGVRLGWDEHDVRHATAELLRVLRGVMPAKSLVHRRRQPKAFGALNPAGNNIGAPSSGTRNSY